MCDLDFGQHFLGWHKFKLGWIDESQLIYFSSGELTTTLTSLEVAKGVKMIVLPSENSSRVYVIECAQSLGDEGQRRDQGLLIYSVDAAAPTGAEPVKVLQCGVDESQDKFGLRCDAFLAEGKRRVVNLANGSQVEVLNRQRVGADFEVAVKIVSS